jgi:activating signal cointegrator 1
VKAISLTQPWASLIAFGAKRIETRSWTTSFHGQVAIHAAKGLGPVGGKRGLYQQCIEQPFRDVIAQAFASSPEEAFDAVQALPLGAIVAVATLVCVRRIDINLRAQILAQTITPHEIDFGNYETGRYAWFLENILPLKEVVPCKGARQLWDVPADVMEKIAQQLEREIA